MAFKNLEERYNAKVNDLYAGAQTKFSGGKPSTVRTDQPFITTTPGKPYTTKNATRSLPAESAALDKKRLSLFQQSPNGIRFLAKQALLQTGSYSNKLLNPLFILSNTSPFFHGKRHLLQRTEYLQTKGASRIGPGPSAFNEGQSWANLLRTNKQNYKGSKLLERYESVLPDIPFIGKKGGFRYANWDKSAPVTRLRPYQGPNLDYLNFLGNASSLLKNAEWFEDNGVSTPLVGDTPFIRYFTGGKESITKLNQAPEISLNARDFANAKEGKREISGNGTPKKISYITDPANLKSTKELKKVAKAYSKMRGIDGDTKQGETFDDAITVAIAMGDGEAVKFRAFIKDIQQTVTPEYKPYQYIGRIEKFVSFVTVQREVSFKLNVVAYSKKELAEVWKKINYLTGTVYPYGFYKGINQPNIARLTIGNLYRDQPGYFTGINMNFTDFGWDIDEKVTQDEENNSYLGGVPMGAELDLKFVIIEKTTKIASSPFYFINEADLDQDFSDVIEGVEPSGTSAPPNNGGTTSQPATGR